MWVGEGKEMMPHCILVAGHLKHIRELFCVCFFRTRGVPGRGHL